VAGLVIRGARLKVALISQWFALTSLAPWSIPWSSISGRFAGKLCLACLLVGWAGTFPHAAQALGRGVLRQHRLFGNALRRCHGLQFLPVFIEPPEARETFKLSQEVVHSPLAG